MAKNKIISYMFLFILFLFSSFFSGCTHKKVEESVIDRNFVTSPPVIGGASLLDPSKDALEWEQELLNFTDINKEKISKLNMLDHYKSDEIMITDFEIELRNKLSFEERSDQEIIEEIIIRHIVIRAAVEKDLFDYGEINNIVQQTSAFRNEKNREIYYEIDAYVAMELLAKSRVQSLLESKQESYEKFLIQKKDAISIKFEK